MRPPIVRTPVIRVEHVFKTFDHKEALRDVSLDVDPQEIFTIMGPSGSGKSTLLRVLVGLIPPDAGTVYIWDVPIHEAPAAQLDELRKRMGVVFQSSALFDSMSVLENVAFPLRRHKRLPEAEVRRIVGHKLELVDLEGTEALMPAELSGGMRKRVGIARALAMDPEMILYDEPTAGLDPLTSETVASLIRRLRDQLGVTSVVVTHDLDAAYTVSDQIGLIWDGELVSVGPPQELLHDPRPEVRRFIQHRVIGPIAAAVGPSSAPQEAPRRR